MLDLESAIDKYLQLMFESVLIAGDFVPTANLFLPEDGQIISSVFGWRNAKEEYERFTQLENLVKQHNPAAVMIMLEANLSTPSTRETPSRKILVDIQFPDAPRQFQIYEIIRDELGRVKAIHFKATAPSTAFNGMNVFDPPTTH